MAAPFVTLELSPGGKEKICVEAVLVETLLLASEVTDCWSTWEADTGKAIVDEVGVPVQKIMLPARDNKIQLEKR